ncbi:MAG: UDP-N-acetylmuramoyl-tripeptide--D-alanyl-D-alanine ligase [Firmicutes bacterium]|nr:UDP-N-acetylmuramoyl-tripeptide--D-alanyl-D-alanine ligase [Bacillota bacterium]
MTLFLISLIPYLIFTIFKTKKSFHMLQQNYYDDDNRYFKWILTNISRIAYENDILFVLITCTLFFEIGVTIGSFIILYGIIFINYRKKKVIAKKPLVVTARIKRLSFTMFLMYFIMIIPFIVNFSYDNLVYCYLLLGLVTYLNYFVVMTANVINKPVEKCVYLHYRHQALKKLKSMNIPVVGITGSYGKTSSKNIINDILNVKLNSFATPKSFNTPYGLINSVNNYLDKFNDIFIAEMGAFKIGEIKQNCKIVKPKYGIITSIGEAHLESFGSRENIMKGKFELIESLPSDGLAILNGDDEYQLKYKIKNNCNVKWIGIDNKDVDLYATNIKLSGRGTTFDCVFKGDKNKYTFNTKLLGKHNVYNILSGILLGKELGLSIEELKRGVSSVKTIEHRLELKKYGNINIIDDAYNSNPVGSKMAVEVLGLMEGLKIIVTPGMIELGPKQYELNHKFGEYISQVCDYVILIGEKQTKPIYDGLIDNKFDKKKIFVLNDVRDAFPLMNRLATKNTYVLLENDLPDLFNE